jgi:hypothetical protein
MIAHELIKPIRDCILSQRMEIFAAWENALRAESHLRVFEGTFDFHEGIRDYYEKALSAITSRAPELPHIFSATNVVKPHSIEARMHLLLTGEKVFAHSLRENLPVNAKDWLEIRYMIHQIFAELLLQDIACACDACSQYILDERNRIQQLESAFEKVVSSR